MTIGQAYSIITIEKMNRENGLQPTVPKVLIKERGRIYEIYNNFYEEKWKNKR